MKLDLNLVPFSRAGSSASGSKGASASAGSCYADAEVGTSGLGLVLVPLIAQGPVWMQFPVP